MKGFCGFQQLNDLKHLFETFIMKKSFNILVSVIFLIGLYFLFRFVFNESNLSIAVILAIGPLGGLSTLSFAGYVLPSKLIFRLRFIIYGITFGIMIGLMLFLTTSIKDRTFVGYHMIKMLIINIPLGVITIGSIISLMYRKLKKRTNGVTDAQYLTSDIALFIDSDNNKISGRLLMSEGKLSFYDLETGKCLFETALSDIHPIIKKLKFLPITIGFSWMNEMNKVNVSFPYYWIKLIDTDRNKMILQP